MSGRKRCITPGCSATTNATRCPACEAKHQAGRNASRPHYGGAWQRISKRAIAAEPWCHTTPTCPHPDAGTPANPLTCDHIKARSLSAGVTVLCRRCNSSKQDQ